MSSFEEIRNNMLNRYGNTTQDDGEKSEFEKLREEMLGKYSGTGGQNTSTSPVEQGAAQPTFQAEDDDYSLKLPTIDPELQVDSGLVSTVAVQSARDTVSPKRQIGSSFGKITADGIVDKDPATQTKRSSIITAQQAQDAYTRAGQLESQLTQKDQELQSSYRQVQESEWQIQRMEERLTFLQSAWEKEPTQANVDLYNLAFSQYQQMYQSYMEQYAAYEAAYKGMIPMRAQYDAALKTYNDYTAMYLNPDGSYNYELLAQAAEKDYQDYIGTEEYRQQAQAQALAGNSYLTGNAPSGANAAADSQAEGLRGLAAYYRQQAKLQADDQTMAADLKGLESWSEEDKRLLETYVYDRMGSMSSLAKSMQAGLLGTQTDGGAEAAAHQAFQTLAAKYGAETVKKYAESWSRYKNAQITQQTREFAEKNSDGWLGGFLGSAGSVAGNLASAVTAPLGFLSDLSLRTGQYQTLDGNSLGNLPSVYAGAARGKVAENLRGEGGLGREALATVYEAGMSALDNVARLAVGGGTGSLVLAATGSFGQEVSQASAEGASPWQAIVRGVGAGAFEVLTEKLSLDNLLKQANTAPGSLWEILKRAAIQGGVEVSEEELSLLANLALETAVMRGQDSYSVRVGELMAEGKTLEEAQSTANREALKEVLDTAVQSFLSGGMMAGARNAWNYAADTGNRRVRRESEQAQRAQQTQAQRRLDDAQQAEFERSGEAAALADSGETITVKMDTGTTTAARLNTQGRVWNLEGTQVADNQAQLAGRLSEATGREIVFYASSRAGEEGYYNPADGRIYISTSCKKVTAKITGHELTHSIEQAGVYRELSGAVMQMLEQDGVDLDQYRQRIRERWAKGGHDLKTQDDVDREIVAKFVEDKLLTNEQSIRALARTNRGLAHRIRSFFDAILAKLHNKQAQERIELERIRNLYAKALGETQSSFTEETEPQGNSLGARTTDTAPAAPVGQSVEAEQTRRTQTEPMRTGDPETDTRLDGFAQMLASGQMSQEDYDENVAWALEEYREKQQTGGAEPDTEPEGLSLPGVDEDTDDDWDDAFDDAFDNQLEDEEISGTTPRRSFAGENADGADLAGMYNAQAMRRQGVDAETIRRETGWHQGRDGKWRFEIDDSGARFYHAGDALFSQMHPKYARHQELIRKYLDEGLTRQEVQEFKDLDDIWGRENQRLKDRVRWGNATLENVLRHDELFKQYPQLRDVRVRLEDTASGVNGYYSASTNTIVLSSRLEGDCLGTLLHEVQHAIQHMEGFAYGSSPEYWAQRQKGQDPIGKRDGRIRRLQKEIQGILDGLPENIAAQFERYTELEQADPEQAMAVANELSEGPYGEQFSDYFTATWDLQIEQGYNEQATPEELYWNTAGEIEARDVTRRQDLTGEQRKNTPPDLGGEETVFVERYLGDSRQAIGRTTDNKPFVEITTDILAGVPRGDWVKTVKQNLRNKFPNGVVVDKNRIRIDNQSRKEMTFSGYMKWLLRHDPQIYRDKLRATDNADEILRATTDWVNEGLRHPRKDRICDFARGNVLLRIGSSDYTAEVVVGTETNGDMKLYDIINLSATNFTAKEMSAVTAEDPSPGTDRSTTDISKESVPQNGGGVKRFSVAEPVEETRDLLAVHNLRAENLRDSMRLGGMPMPSIAVIRGDDAYTDYGDISIVFRKDSIAPEADARNRVYGADVWTPTLGQIDWDSLPENYTQEDIVEAMKALGDRGVRMGHGGAFNLMAYAPPEYGSVEDIRQDRGRLLEPDSEELDDSLMQLVDTEDIIQEIAGTSGDAMDAAYQALYEGARSDREAGIIREIFREYGFGLSDSQIETIQQSYQAAAGYKTGYFEAKPERVVRPDEWALVAVPDDMDPQLRRDLEMSGANVVEYRSGDTASRVAAVNSMPELRFSVAEEYEPESEYLAGIDTQELISSAQQAFGTTNRWDETGWLTTDGKRLDFTDRRWGGPGGYRTEDHRDILEVYPDEGGDLSGPEALVDFMARGNVRIMPESGGINLSTPPMDAQERMLRNYITMNDGEVILDIDNFNGKTVASVEYPRGTKADRVLRDIRQYFRDGTKPRISDVQRFRYSVAEDEEVPGLSLPTVEDGETTGDEQETPAGEQGYSREALPRRAREYLERAERKLVKFLGEGLVGDDAAVPANARKEVLMPVMRKLSDEYLRTGALDQELAGELFDKAFAESIVRETAYYDQYKDVGKYLRTTSVTIAKQDQADIADFGIWRKGTFGTLRIVNEGGLPVDTAYGELHTMAPELFPEGITHPADQLQRIFEVGKSIRVTEKSLQEFYGPETERRRQWARYDFDNAVNKILPDLRQVRRYADEAAARAAEEAEKAPTTPEEAEDAYKQLKGARREYERAAAKHLLTEKDEQQVGRLLKGEISPEHLDPEAAGTKGILAVYEAKQEYERLCKLIGEYKRGLHTQLREKANSYLGNAIEWKDKRVGFAYSRETMRRNIMDIVPSMAQAKQIIREYFEPVQIAEAASTRFKNRYRDRVRQLKLSRSVDKKAGNIVSEAHAVQLLGEAMDNIAYLKKARRQDATRDGKTLEEWQAVVDDLWANNPGLNADKIEGAVREFRKIYDELFQQMNQVRVKNGYEPVNYRQGYFPHFQPGDGDGILAAFGRAVGIDTQVAALPTTINGLTHTFKPGIRWFGNAQERLGFNTAYDSVEGFDKYIEGVAGVIHQTENIQKLRALASQIRHNTTDEGIRKQVDAVQADSRLTEEEKKAIIDKIYEHGKYTLSNFVVELEEYTNLLANKKSKLDRTTEALLGRRMYTIMKNWESRVGANMIAGNVTSAITNFIPLTQAGARIGKGHMLQGMWDTLRGLRKSDGLTGMSDFLTNRRGSEALVQKWTEVASRKAGILMELIDNFTSESIVRAAYYRNLKQGLSEAEALHQADIFAAGVMADRSKGAMPTLFESTNPVFKMFTQFQLEVNNQLSEVFKDLPREVREQIPEEERGKRTAKLGGVLLQYFIGALLFNDLYEYFIGRRPALDPIGMLNSAVGDATGYQLPNVFEMWENGIEAEDFQTEKAGIGQAGANLAGDVLGSMPFSAGLTLFGIETDGGRIPASSAVPDLTALWDAATTEGWSAEKRWKEVQDELNKLAYIIPPFMGNQIQKIWKGVEAYIQGGSYSVDSGGNDILQYPIFKDGGFGEFWTAAQAALFGKSSLDEAQEWVDSGFNSLGAKQTAVYQDMLEAGVDDRDAYGLLRELEGAEKTETESREAIQREMLRDSEISDEGKSIVYYGLLASDSEQELMDKLADAGADQCGSYDLVMGLRDAAELKGAERKEAESELLKTSGLTEEEKSIVVGRLLGTELLTEEGKPTQYAKFLSAAEGGLSVDRYMELRSEGADIDDYLELTDAGIEPDAAADLVSELGDLEPEEGAKNVSALQRCQTIVAADLPQDQQMAALKAYMTESDYTKLETGYGLGVTPEAYVGLKMLLPEYDADGNGSYTQAEAKDAIDALADNVPDDVLMALMGMRTGPELSNDMKAILWQLCNKSWSWRKNPYSTKVGEEVYRILNPEKE